MHRRKMEKQGMKKCVMGKSRRRERDEKKR